VYETLAISAPTVVDATLGRVTKAACDARIERWSTRIVRRLGAQLEVRGRENARGGPFVIMSNHQSHYDIFVLFKAYPGVLRMVAKIELARVPILGGGMKAAELARRVRIPVFGAAMRGAGFIAVDRADRARAIQSLATAKPLLESGTHLWIAPEGTRSRTGALGPFKKGGFLLAEQLGVPILPITIDGTRNILPSSGLLSSPGQRVVVTIHRPVPPPAGGPDPRAARERTLDAVRAAIASALP
jgi:1-acyl-sn-glycerol-3-phosphate acyltransferase